MQIICVQLKDLRSYGEATITFEPGVNAIVGNNGAGKSTVLAAIGLALFNTKPPNNKLDDLVREGAKTAEVVVDFQSALDERRYQVVRRLGSSSSYKVHDPELGHDVMAEGVSDVEDWLRTHLGVGAGVSLSDLFEHTIGVYQGTFTAPFLLTAAVRKPIFDPLLRVDEYPRAVAALLEPRRVLDQQDQQAQVQLGRLAGQLDALPGLRQEVVAVQARIVSIEPVLAATRTAAMAAQARCEAWDSRREALTAASRARDQLAAEAGQQQATLTGAQENLARAEQAMKRTAEATPGHEQYEAAEQARAGLEIERRRREALLARVGELEAQLAALDAQERGYRQQLQALDAVAKRAAELEPLAAQQAKLEAILASAREAALHLQQAQKTCSDLEAQRQAQTTRLADLAAELEERERLTAEQVDIQAALDRLQQEAEQRQLRRGACQAAHSQGAKQLADLAQAEGGLCPVCEEPLTEAHRLELQQRVQAELTALAEQVTALEREQRHAEQERSALQGQARLYAKRLSSLATVAQVAVASQDLAQTAERLVQTSAQVSGWGEPVSEIERSQIELSRLGNPAQGLATCRTQLDQRPRLEAELAAALKRQEAIQADLAGERAALLPFADLEQRLAAVGAALAENRAAHNAYLANQGEAGQLAARQERVVILAAALAALGARLAAAEAALQAAEAQYDVAADQQAQLDRLRLEAEAASQAATLAADRTALAQAEQRVAALEALLAQQAALEAERARIKAATELIDWARELLKAAGPFVTRQLVRSVSLEAAKLYSELMDNYGVQLEWSETYELTLEVGGQQRGFAQLSGGEQMCAALALRLALLRSLTGIDIAFFDEPTAHLDGERRATLAHTLTHVQGFGQIFVISHDSTFEEAAQAYFQVTKDGDGSHIERL